MPSALPTELFQQGLITLLMVGGPLFVTLLVVGLFIGILQSATQVNDPSIGFLSRLLCALAVCWLSGSWMLERLSAYLGQAFMALAGH